MVLTAHTLSITPVWEIAIHNFHRGDEDPDCHDHPFHFWSLIIWGGYYEFDEQGNYMKRSAGSITFRDAAHRHRVELIKNSCWTLCIKRPVKREWGFYKDGVFIPWRAYIKQKGLEPIN